MVASALTGLRVKMAFPNTWLLPCRAHAILAVEILKTKNILVYFNISTENAACLKAQGKVDPILQSR